MAVFEIQGPDGKTYEVEAPDMQSAVGAIQSLVGGTGGVSADGGAVDEFISKGDSLLQGAHNGVSLGFGDNLAGVRGALFGQTVGEDGSMSRDMSGNAADRYARERDAYRERAEASAKANPMQSTAGNILGASIPSLAAAPFATGASLLGTMGRGAAIGGVEGGLMGAGLADGEDVGASAGKGSLIGGLLGLGAPAVVHGAAATKNAIKDPVTGVFEALFDRANTGKANRAIANTVRASGKNPDELGQSVMRAAQEGQSEYRLMDALGIPGQRRASGIARAGGDSGAEIADFLARRQAGQGERVGGFVNDAYGFGGAPYVGAPGKPGAVLARPQATAKTAQDGLKSARAKEADTAYDAARGNAAPVDVRGALSVIDSRIGGMKGSNVKGDGVDAKLSRYRTRLAADPVPNGEISRELSDFDRVLGVKQDVQDDIGAAVRAGRNNEARELGKLAQELDAALEASSDMYRTANDSFRDASRVIDAVDEGKSMSRPSARSADTTAQFSRMTPEQQQAARFGYGDSLLGRIEANASPTSNRAKPLQSPKRAAEAQAMALQPDLYARRLTRENDMWETQNRALGGSRTADNLEDIESVNSAASGLLGAARAAGNLQLGDAVAQIGSVLGTAAKGQTDGTRQLIARALLSKDPMKALEPALKQYNATQGQRRFIEAILRGATRQPAVSSVQ